MPLTAPDMQALQLTGSVGSGSSIQSDSMGAGHQSSVQQVLEMLKKRQPVDAGKQLSKSPKSVGSFWDHFCNLQKHSTNRQSKFLQAE